MSPERFRCHGVMGNMTEHTDLLFVEGADISRTGNGEVVEGILDTFPGMCRRDQEEKQHRSRMEKKRETR